jgi:DNA replication protein DnaC
VQDAGVKEALRFYAKQLKLPTFKDVSEPAAKFRPGQSLEEFVLGLMKREYASRQEKQQQRRLKRAHFPMLKTLEEFDLTRLEHVRPEYVKHLASCDFIKRHENLVMIGNPGTGENTSDDSPWSESLSAGLEGHFLQCHNAGN